MKDFSLRIKNKTIEKFIDMFKFIHNFLKDWISLFQILMTTVVEIMRNPSFVMFSLMAIGLGTMGIWIPLLPYENSEAPKLILQTQSLSVFTFCVASLGNMATEYIFNEKGKENGEITDASMLSKHAVFFIWTISIFLSFLCLINPTYAIDALSLTLILWLFVNIHRSKFRHANKSAIDNLLPDLNDKTVTENNELGGDGL